MATMTSRSTAREGSMNFHGAMGELEFATSLDPILDKAIVRTLSLAIFVWIGRFMWIRFNLRVAQFSRRSFGAEQVLAI